MVAHVVQFVCTETPSEAVYLVSLGMASCEVSLAHSPPLARHPQIGPAGLPLSLDSALLKTTRFTYPPL